MNALAAWILLALLVLSPESPAGPVDPAVTAGTIRKWAEGAEHAASVASSLPESGARFVSNAGQWDPRALGRMRMGPATVWLTAEGWRLDLRRGDQGVVVAFELGEGDARPIFEGPGEERRSYFLGSGSERGRGRWQSGLATHERVRLASIAQGVDLVLRTREQELQYDLELGSGVDLDSLEIVVRGAEGLELDADGQLVVHTALGSISQSPPVSWNVTSSGERIPVSSAFVLRGADRFGFSVSGSRAGLPLTIDPGLQWSSFLGASDLDSPAAIAVDPAGRTIVAGTTSSFEFPVSPGAYDVQLSGPGDVFVTCFNPDGSGFLWTTLLGGNDGESVVALDLTDALEVVLAGETRSADFPTTAGVIDSTHNGLSDVFVTRLNRDGSALVNSTFLGSAGNDTTGAMVLDANGDVLLGGATNNGSFPTTAGAFRTIFQGGPFSATDGFLARLDADTTSLLQSTFLGGLGADTVQALSLSSAGNVHVGGITASSNFPVPGAFDGVLDGANDGFVAELNGTLSVLTWSTFLGGGDEDTVTALVDLPDGSVAAGGWSLSQDFPTTVGALQPSSGGLRDAFVSVLQPGGSALAWSTYLGGDQDDELTSLAVDSTGRPVAVGATQSRFFPITPFGFQAWFRGPYPVGSGGGDGWLARFEADGSGLAYGSFLGGSQDDRATAVAVTANDEVRIAGQTTSANFPTSLGAVDRVFDFSGFPDGFTLALDFARYPFAYGIGKTTSISALPYLLWSGFPGLSSIQNSQSFRISIEDACPNTGIGVLFVSDSGAEVPQGLGTRYIGMPVRRAASTVLGFFGSGSMVIDIQPWMVGRTLHYQLVFRDPGAANGVGLSDGLEVTFHP